MISYPSSFQSSRMSDKQNINPNNQKTKATGCSPCEKQKFLNLQSNKSEQLFSVYRTIKEDNNQISNKSIKTLVQGFCSIVQEAQENTDNESFIKMAIRYYGKGQLSIPQIVQLCKKDGLLNKQDIIDRTSGQFVQQYRNDKWKFKNMLISDLGQLIVDELCNCIQKGSELTQEQQRMIQQLLPYNTQSEINRALIMEQYDNLKGEKLGEKAQIEDLAKQFRKIRKENIESKIWSDHFRLQIGKSLNYRQEKERTNFHLLNKCFNNILNSNQVSIVFRYIFTLETGILMPILDTSKTISSKLLKANLLRDGDSEVLSVDLQEKNAGFHAQQNYKRIKRLQQQNRKYLQNVSNKDKEIERLNRIIDLMQLQREQNQNLRQTQIKVQLEACRKRYEKRIEELIQRNENQARMTQWYRRQLEVMMDSINKQNIMRKHLVHKF